MAVSVYKPPKPTPEAQIIEELRSSRAITEKQCSALLKALEPKAPVVYVFEVVDRDEDGLIKKVKATPTEK